MYEFDKFYYIFFKMCKSTIIKNWQFFKLMLS